MSAAPPPLPPASSQQQFWLLVGVILILGSGFNFFIPLIASLAFIVIVITIAGVFEFVLNDRQKAAVNAALSKLVPGKRKADPWASLPSVTHSPAHSDDLAAHDTFKGSKDAASAPIAKGGY
jgi:hypothetical protein